MIYYIHKDGQEVGPLTLEELKKQNLTAITKVWREDMPNWVNAAEINELKNTITKIPPPLSTPKPPALSLSLNEPTSNDMDSQLNEQLRINLGWYKASLIAFFIGVIIVFISSLNKAGLFTDEFDRNVKQLGIGILIGFIGLILTIIFAYKVKSIRQKLLK